jgi:FkbM family methyltransferase
LRALWIGSLLRAAPQFPGRNTMLGRVRRFVCGFDVPVEGVFGPGLRCLGNPREDSNSVEPLLMRYSEPELAPILDAALSSAGCFADLGANVGVYSLWAAQRVGVQGRVVAFEPIPETRARLERNIALNGFAQIRVVPRAVGAEPGSATLHVVPGASGLTSRDRAVGGDEIAVEVTTLDAYFAGAAPPDLIKIDVEGMELEVLRGARSLLAGDAPPLVVFEAHHVDTVGSSYAGILDFLAETGGYEVWSLSPRGIRREARGSAVPGSGDVLAARPDVAAHAQALERLRTARFRDQVPSPQARLLGRLRRLRSPQRKR